MRHPWALMESETAPEYASLPRVPVAAEISCPATGARATGRVQELTAVGARIAFEVELVDFDVGAAVDVTFVSSVLGGSHTVRGRVVRSEPTALELRFEPGSTTPLVALFNRRNSLRIRREALPLDHSVELVVGSAPPSHASLEDLSMQGAAVVVRGAEATPRPAERVRLQLSNPRTGLTVWMSGEVRHVSGEAQVHRLGIAFDMRMADIEGAGPALRTLVREIEQAQLDMLVLAHAGLIPEDTE